MKSPVLILPNSRRSVTGKVCAFKTGLLLCSVSRLTICLVRETSKQQKLERHVMTAVSHIHGIDLRSRSATGHHLSLCLKNLQKLYHVYPFSLISSVKKKKKILKCRLDNYCKWNLECIFFLFCHWNFFCRYLLGSSIWRSSVIRHVKSPYFWN